MFKKIMPHVSIVLSLIILTLYILDQFNSGMDLVGNDFIKAVMFVYCVVVLVVSFILVIRNRKDNE